MCGHVQLIPGITGTVRAGGSPVETTGGLHMKAVRYIALFSALFLGLCIVSLPVHAESLKIGIIRTSAPYAEEQLRGFIDKMKELGYIDGKNVQYTIRVVGSRVEEFPVNAAIAKEIVGDKGIDLLATIGTQASEPVWPAIKGTGVPMVFAGVTFPEECSLVPAMGKPSGENITGLGYGISPEERIAMMRDMFPDVNKFKQIAFLYSGAVRQEIIYAKHLSASSNMLNWKLTFIDFYNYETKKPDYDILIRRLQEVSPDIAFGFFSLDQLSADDADCQRFLNAFRIPIIGITSKFTDDGAIGGVLTDHIALGAQHAVMVDRILKGEKAGNIPSEHPKKYLLELNLKQAKLLGITFPQGVISKASRIIK